MPLAESIPRNASFAPRSLHETPSKHASVTQHAYEPSFSNISHREMITARTPGEGQTAPPAYRHHAQQTLEAQSVSAQTHTKQAYRSIQYEFVPVHPNNKRKRTKNGASCTSSRSSKKRPEKMAEEENGETKSVLASMNRTAAPQQYTGKTKEMRSRDEEELERRQNQQTGNEKLTFEEQSLREQQKAKQVREELKLERIINPS
ncbi:hypothetical protein NA57DRAFT_76350 [Rhizodiscina lignyota]|uniref:Uncharacterized protein n=1 Tax=Rhizodiscina lignyota TaxID=1504668 RepID=A0A9P4M988_9PEZI|nr:hypothetical protein NA57DRAFT_76350 [Rhizodiscina lignyota]